MSPSINTRENREFASELKFVVAVDLVEGVRRWARSRLAPDPHAGGRDGDTYRVTSLYFDTEAMDVFNRRGSFGRSKYRVRRYGHTVIAFLERKLKTRGLVTKRRTTVPLAELAHLDGPSAPQGWPGEWFRRRLELRRMAPICQISYSRMARFAQTARGLIRLTLDQNLRASPLARRAFNRDEGTLLSGDWAILELKFLFALPAQFKQLVEEFRLEPRPFSKYRFAAHKLGLAAAPEYERLEAELESSNLCLTS